MKKSNKLARLSGGLAGLGVVVCIAVAVNVILGNLNLRKDLTEEKLYELSEGTREILTRLERPVTLKLFFNGASPEVPVQLKQFAQRVEDLLVEYEMAADGNIIIEKYDPEPDSDAEEWAQQYGLKGQSLGLMGPVLYLGLVASAGDTEATLPVLDPRTENLLEYNITRMISRLANPTKPIIGVISDLPVLGAPRPPYPMPNQPAPAPAWFAFQELKQDFELRELKPPLEDIGEDVHALIVVHPKELEDGTLYAIDQFVLRGGSLMVFLDPLCVTETETRLTPQMQFGGFSSQLDTLLNAWGVSFDSGKVVADLGAVSRLRNADNRVEDSPVWLSLRRANFNAEDVLTSNIESIMMPYAGAFEVEAEDSVEVTSLVASSDRSALMDAMTVQFGGESIRRGFKSGMKPLDLVVRLHGKLATAFPDGKPSAPEDDGEEKEDTAGDEEQTAEEGLKESVDKSTVVLFGDVDMLYDRFCVEAMNFFGFTAHQPMNDNLSLLLNGVEQIAGSTSLVSIRTRGKTERPFEVVLALQHEAQEKYMEEETRLQQRLEEAQRKLNDLQAQKDDKQRYILSPRQQQEIDNFQEEVLSTKRQLKLVRRKLRRDIELLGMKLKVINIILMPALVSIAGVGFGVYRSRRTKG